MNLNLEDVVATIIFLCAVVFIVVIIFIALSHLRNSGKQKQMINQKLDAIFLNEK